MKAGKYKIIKKETVSASGRLVMLKLATPDVVSHPGQFVNILVDDHYLRRPISVADFREGVMTLIIDQVGDGTRKICAKEAGEELDMLTQLGNSFSLSPSGKNPALIGGGVGFAPLVGLAKAMKARGCSPVCFWGFNAEEDVPVPVVKELEALGIEVKIATMKAGSHFCGNPVEMALEFYGKSGCMPEFFYTCGPLKMMEAVAGKFDCPGEMSLDSRMGCGFGACMCCSVETEEGPKRICREGPVFGIGKTIVKS